MFKWTSKGSLSSYNTDDSLGDAKVTSKSRHTPESPCDRRRSKIDSYESSAVNERQTRSHSKPKRQRDRSAPSRPENSGDSDGKDTNSRKGNLLNKFKKIFQRSSSKGRGSKSAPSSPTSDSRFDRTASLVDGRPPSNVPKAKRSRSRLERLIDAKKDYRRLGQSKVTPSFSDIADDESDSTACYRTNAERHCDRPTNLNLSYENGIQDKQKYGEGEAAYLTGTPPSGKWSSFLVKNTRDGSDFKVKRLAQKAKNASTLSDTCILTFRDRQSIDDIDSSQTSISSPDPDDHGPVVMEIEARETLQRQSDNVMLKNKMFGLSPSAYSYDSSRYLQNWMDTVKTIDPFVLCQMKKSLKRVNTYMPEGETKKMTETCRRLTFSHNKDGGLSVSPKSNNSPRNLRPAKQTTCADKTAQAGTKNNNNGHNSLHTRNHIDILSPESFPKNRAHGDNEHTSPRPYSQFMFNESVSFSRTPFYKKTRFQDSQQCSKVQRIVHSLEEKLATPLNTTPPTVHANPNLDSMASLGLPAKNTVSHVHNCNQRVPTLTSLCQLKNAGHAPCFSEPSPSISSRTTSRSTESSPSKGFRPSSLPLVDYLNDNSNERSGSESGSGQGKRHQVEKSYGDEARRVTSKLSLYLSPTTPNMKSVEVIDKSSPWTVSLSLSEQIPDKMRCSDTSESAEALYALDASNSLDSTDRVGLSDTADTSDIAGISTFMDVFDKTDVSDIINVSGIDKVSENVPAEEFASDTTDIAYMSDVMNVSDIDSVDQDMHNDGSEEVADEDRSKSSIIWNGEYTDYDEVVCAGVCLEDKTHNDLADDSCHGKSSSFGNTSDCSGQFGAVYNRDEPCHVFSRDNEYAEHARNGLRYTDSDILEGLVEEDSCEEKTLSSLDLQTPEPSLSVGKGNSDWCDENAARSIRLERHDSPCCDEKAHDVSPEKDLSEMSDKSPLELLELKEKETPGLGDAFCNSTTLKVPLDSSMAYSQEVGGGSLTSQIMEQEEMVEATQGSEQENGVTSFRGSDGVSIKHEDPDETRLDMEQDSSISKKDEKLTVSHFTTTDSCDVAARQLNEAYDTRNDLTSCIDQTNSREIKKERCECEGDPRFDESEEERQKKFKMNEEEERQEEFRMKEEWSDRCQRNERDRNNEQMSERGKEEEPNSVRSNEDLKQLGHRYNEMSKSWKSEEQSVSQMREAENSEDQKTKGYWNNRDHSSSLAKEGCIEEMRTKSERSLGGHRYYKMTEMEFEQPMSKKSQRESSSRVEWVQASNSSEDKAIVDLSCLSHDSPTSKDHQTVGASTSLSDSIYDMDWSVFSQEPRLGNTPCQRSSNTQVEASPTTGQGQVQGQSIYDMDCSVFSQEPRLGNTPCQRSSNTQVEASPTAGQGQVQGQSKPNEGDASSGRSHDFPFETTCSSGNMKEMDVGADGEADGAIIVKDATDLVSLNTTSLSVKGRGSCVNVRGEVSATHLKSNISNVEPMPEGRLVEKQEDYCDDVVRVKECHTDETERIISADIKEGSDNDLRGKVAKDDIQNNDASMAEENVVESEENRMCIDVMGESSLNCYREEIRVDGKDDLIELKFGIDGLEKRKHVEWVDGIKSDYTNFNVKENNDVSNNVYTNEADSRFNVTLTDDGSVDICANEIGGGLLEWVFSDQGTQPNRELIPGDEIDEDERYNSGDDEEEDQIDSPVDVNFEESWVPGDVGEVSTVKCATSDDQMSWEVGSHNISLTWKDTTAGDIEETALRDALSVEDPRLTQDLHELSLDSATRCIADYYRSLSHLQPGEAMMSKLSDDTYNDLTMDSYANASLFSELHDDGSGDQSKSQEDTERHESEKKFLEGLPTTSLMADGVHKQQTASGSSSQLSIATRTWTIDNMEAWRQRRLEDMTYKRNNKRNRHVKVIVNEIGRRVKVKRSNSGHGERNVRRENAQNRPLMNLMSSTTKRYAQKGMGNLVEPETERDSDGMGEVVKHKHVTAGIPKRYRKREVRKRQEATRNVCEMKEFSPKYYRYHHRQMRPGPESDYSKYEMDEIAKAKQHTGVPSRYPHSGENIKAESTHSMHEVGQTVKADCKQGSTGKARGKWSQQEGGCYIPKQWLFLSTMFFFQFVIHWLYAR